MAEWDDVYARMGNGGNAPKAPGAVCDMGLARQMYGGGRNKTDAMDAWMRAGRPDQASFQFQPTRPYRAPNAPGSAGMNPRPAGPPPSGGGHAPGGPAGPNLGPPGGGMMKPGMGGMGGQSGSSPRMIASALRDMSGGMQRPGMDPNATGGMGGAWMGGMGGASPQITGGMNPSAGAADWDSGSLMLGRQFPQGAGPGGDFGGMEMGANPSMGGREWAGGSPGGFMGSQMPGRTLRAPQFSGMNQSMYPQPQGGRANYGNAQPFFGFSQR